MSFQGCITALVTPFRRGGEIDFPALARHIEFQVDCGVDGIIPCGTTGEVPTLTADEQKKVIEFTIDKASGRVEVIAGTGSNSTAKSIEMTRFAQKAGASGALLVTPYYNKPTQEGLYRHFAAIAESSSLRVMLYNVPSRCVVSISPETAARLAAFENVVAIKEAGGDVSAVSRIRALCDLAVLSGDDVLTLPMLSLGAVGVVSVVSNLLPVEIVSMIRAAADGDWDEARRGHERLLPIFETLFLEPNPQGIKSALAMTGQIEDEIRLPLIPFSSANREKLRAAMLGLGLLQNASKRVEKRRVEAGSKKKRLAR